MTSSPIVARELVRHFGTGDNIVKAVDGVDLEVRTGEIFGLLGPNGAGKSTIVRMLTTLLKPTAGSAHVAGFDVVKEADKVRRSIGVALQDAAIDPLMTGRELLNLQAVLYGLSKSAGRARGDELLERVGLTAAAERRVGTYSGGMRRRLDLALSLVHEPTVLFLDEPTTGLDPQARHILWDRLYRLKQQGVTLVLTTHYMDEAEQLCDRLVVMDGGRIVAEGSPRELITRHSTREVLELRFGAGSNAEHEGRLLGVGDRLEVLADRVLVYADDGESALHEVHSRGLEPESSLVRRSSLEDVFLRLTGRSLEE